MIRSKAGESKAGEARLVKSNSSNSKTGQATARIKQDDNGVLVGEAVVGEGINEK